jgi:hypothetical protein
MTGAVARQWLGIRATYYTVSYYRERPVDSGTYQQVTPLDAIGANTLALLGDQAMSRSAFSCWLISRATTAIAMRAVEMVVRR